MGDLMDIFLRYEFGGLLFGGAFFRNFTVTSIHKSIIILFDMSKLKN